MPLAEIDYEAVGKYLRGPKMATIVRDAADGIAANARGDQHLYGGSIHVADFVTDRAMSVVLFSQPNADAIQAKHGILTRAAAASGFEVKQKKKSGGGK